jgi:hypothetical protein
MRTSVGIGVLMLVLLISFNSIALADHHAKIGDRGSPLILSLMNPGILAFGYDTDCCLIYSLGDCDQWDSGWKCWTKAKYERYGYDPEQGWHELPISVTATGYGVNEGGCECVELR